MSKFERIYDIDNSREVDRPRERHHTIELSDREHLERLGVKFSDDPTYVKFNEGTKFDDEPLKKSTKLKQKFDKVKSLTVDTPVIGLGKKNEKSKSKKTKSTAKKNNPRANKAAVARVQKEL